VSRSAVAASSRFSPGVHRQLVTAVPSGCGWCLRPGGQHHQRLQEPKKARLKWQFASQPVSYPTPVAKFDLPQDGRRSAVARYNRSAGQLIEKAERWRRPRLHAGR